ncbi:unnamed protein product, partial [Polarella glacialis]
RHAFVVAVVLAATVCAPRLSADLGQSTAFARKHVFPVGVRELRDRLGEEGISKPERSSTLKGLQDAYEQDILKWGNRRKWEKALGLFREMQEFDYQPGVAAYAAAISACGMRAREWRRSLVLMEEMKGLGMIPDENSLQGLMISLHQ